MFSITFQGKAGWLWQATPMRILHWTWRMEAWACYAMSRVRRNCLMFYWLRITLRTNKEILSWSKVLRGNCRRHGWVMACVDLQVTSLDRWQFQIRLWSLRSKHNRNSLYYNSHKTSLWFVVWVRTNRGRMDMVRPADFLILTTRMKIIKWPTHTNNDD